jgi:nucleotide-binding universal stress UspA family protein
MKPSVVLCAVDFSPPARVAFEEACRVARDAGARLVLVHVHEPLFMPLPEVPIVPAELILQDRAARQKQLLALQAEAVGQGLGGVEADIVNGVPWDRIVAAARTYGCQLVVMGTHGRTGLKHAFLGSVAEKVVRHAPCSVLVVRSAEAA